MSSIRGSACLKRRVYLGFDQGELICHCLKMACPANYDSGDHIESNTETTVEDL